MNNPELKYGEKGKKAKRRREDADYFLNLPLFPFSPFPPALLIKRERI
jgi:hypothetical protein